MKKQFLITALAIVLWFVTVAFCFAQKPVYIQHTRQDVIAANPEFFEYLNLHGWFYYPKVDGQYNTAAGPNIGVFRTNWLNGAYPSYMDSNHPTKKQLQTVDIESFDFSKIDDPKWKERANQVGQVLLTMKSDGREVLAYGIDGDRTFVNYWEYYRLLYERHAAFHVVVQKMDQLENHKKSIRKCHQRFRSMLDYHSVTAYSPYWIPSADSWQMDAYLYSLEQRVKFRKSMSNKPVAVWLQLEVTQASAEFDKPAFTPMPEDVWSRIVEWCRASHDVDQIMIFSKNESPPDYWLEPLK